MVYKPVIIDYIQIEIENSQRRYDGIYRLNAKVGGVLTEAWSFRIYIY